MDIRILNYFGGGASGLSLQIRVAAWFPRDVVDVLLAAGLISDPETDTLAACPCAIESSHVRHNVRTTIPPLPHHLFVSR